MMDNIRLGEVVSINPDSITRNYAFQIIEYIDISSVGSGTLKETKSIPIEKAPSRAKRLIKEGDTIISTVRPNRRSFLFIKNPLPNTVVSTGFAVLRATEAINERYLYCSVSNQAFTDYLTSRAKGAAYPAVDTDIIADAKILLPPLLTQRKIASILSAYDDLIENNNRHIKILEEIAQRIYREWFVHFRYPGLEDANFVESKLGKIPDRWDVKKLEEISRRITDGSHWSPKSIDQGYPMASVKDMHNWGINIEKCRTISEEDFNNLVRNDCKPMKNDVLIAKDGSYLKHIFVTEEEINLVILSSIAIIRPNELIKPRLLAHYLKQPNVKSRMAGFVTGAALPRIILKDFRKFLVLLPPMELQEKFNELIKPMCNLCIKVVKENMNLRQIRDLLLPKLISGKIDVSELDIDIGEMNVSL